MTRGFSQAFAALCWAVSICVFFLPIVNSDLFWHLSAAKWMVSTHIWPRADWLSYTMQGRPWVDFEWLCELIWHGTLAGGGLWGLVVLKAALLATAAVLVWKELGLYALGLEAKAAAVLAWSIAGVTANDLRPENFSLIFFALEWWMLEARRLRQRPPLPFWALVPIYILWANLHAGFAYGWILLAIYALVETVRTRKMGLIFWAVCALAATLINPYGWKLHGALWEHAGAMRAMQTYIDEWQKPELTNIWALPFWGVLFVTFAAVLGRYLEDRKVPPEHFIALGFFSFSAVNHNRLSVYFIPIGLALIACHGPALRWVRARPRRMSVFGATLAMICFFGIKLAPALALGQAFIPRYVPDQLVSFFEEERPALRGHRMLNPWAWGGYLGYKLYPDMQVFVDGRYLFHPMLDVMRSARESPQSYLSLLDRYGVDIVADRLLPQLFALPVVLKGGKRTEIRRPYYFAYLPEQDWALVYWNRQGLIFIRRSAFSKKWINENEYRIFRPFDREAAHLLLQSGTVPWARLSAETKRFARWSPEDPQAAALMRE